MSTLYALVPAGGSGRRFGGPIKKQVLELGGKPLFERSLQVLLKSGFFEKIVVAWPQEEAVPQGLDNRILFVHGGGSRAHSVKKAFEAINSQGEDLILIHDAARALVSLELIQRVLRKASQSSAVIPVIDVSDTLKEVDEGRVVQTHDRSKLKAVQTPQCFRAQVLKDLYKRYSLEELGCFTDESMGVESMNVPVSVVLGDPQNIKVTTPLDLEWARFLLGGTVEKCPSTAL